MTWSEIRDVAEAALIEEVTLEALKGPWNLKCPGSPGNSGIPGANLKQKFLDFLKLLKIVSKKNH